MRLTNIIVYDSIYIQKDNIDFGCHSQHAIAYDKADSCFSSQLPYRCVYFLNYFVAVECRSFKFWFILYACRQYLQRNKLPSIAKSN